MDRNETEKREAMKRLRAARKPWTLRTAATVKSQKRAFKAVKEQLGKGAATVPQIAGATNMPSAEVLWYITTMRKYGEVVEAEKDGSYFRYRLGESVAEEGVK